MGTKKILKTLATAKKNVIICITKHTNLNFILNRKDLVFYRATVWITLFLNIRFWLRILQSVLYIFKALDCEDLVILQSKRYFLILFREKKERKTGSNMSWMQARQTLWSSWLWRLSWKQLFATCHLNAAFVPKSVLGTVASCFICTL